MKKIGLVVLVIAVGCAAIAKDKKKAKKQPANEIISVALSHTPCYGRCPYYSVEVNKNGIATYTGIRFAADSGVYTKNIGKKKATQIINKFAAYHVDTCQDRYPKKIEDLPGMMLKIKYTAKEKTISNANLGPLELRGIMASIDSITTDKLDHTWKRSASPVK